MDVSLTAKLTLEAELARPVVQVLHAYITTWAANEGNMPMQARVAYLDALRSALERHYGRVVAAMLGQIPSTDSTIDKVALSIAHAERLHDRARERASYIIGAVERDLVAGLALTAASAPTDDAAKALDGALETKADDKRPFSVGYATRFQATAAQAFYKVRAKLRALVNAETQEPAEQSMFEWVRRRLGNAPVVKVWNTVGDERVRASHVAAGNTYNVEGAIPVDQPFDLAGGRLMFPGDGSMGASLSETINCRCSVQYLAKTPEGYTPLGLATPSIPARRPYQPGDRFGQEIPVTATELVTLNGKTRARVVLGDHATFATLSQTSPSTINVLIDGQVVARAIHERGQVRSLTIAPGRESLGIERLIRESVAHSWARRPRQ